MGYTALNAGSPVSPRGVGAILAMPIIGFLTAKIDNRYLIAFGFFLFAVCSLWFGPRQPRISQWSLSVAIILSGFGSGWSSFRSRPLRWQACATKRSAMPADSTTCCATSAEASASRS